MRDLVVGVDAGGSKVEVSIDGSDRLPIALGASGNPMTAGVQSAAETIARAIGDALDGANAAAIVVGAAGAGREPVARALESALQARFDGARVRVVDDVRIALRGAVPEGDGLALVAGTGSIAYAEVGGNAYRAGGHGYILGDEGSGFAIGSAALRLLVRSLDGRAPRDPMLDALADRLGAAAASDVVAHVYGQPSPVAAVASVATTVVEFAGNGERSAAKIVQGAALDLFELVRAVWRASAAGERELPIAFCGGLLCENSMLTYLLETRIANELPHLHVIKGSRAAEGALVLARALLEER